MAADQIDVHILANRLHVILHEDDDKPGTRNHVLGLIESANQLELAARRLVEEAANMMMNFNLTSIEKVNAAFEEIGGIDELHELNKEARPLTR